MDAFIATSSIGQRVLRGAVPRTSGSPPGRRFARVGLGSVHRGTRPTMVSTGSSPPMATRSSLADLRYRNTFVEELPGDPITENYTRQVEGAVYSRVQPTPVAEERQPGDGNVEEPKLVGWSKEAAELLGLAEGVEAEKETVEILAGAKVVEGMAPFAQAYGGHQFGSWAGQLGDGRAISLGQVIGRDEQKWEIQLKGAGKTPYSRFADGRAVMRSSVREFLCSEAMHHLGIPTTRALSLVSTGAGVLRDQFYNGNAKIEPGAVVCRMAPSFIRLGTFELPAARQDTDLLKQIADYTIREHYPEYASASKDPRVGDNAYSRMLRDVIRRTAAMIADWQSVGFVHGVCNTDNFSVLGLTIDYGPYGFLEDFDPSYTPNTTDLPGRRYCYGSQPSVGLWNLLQFTQALLPLMTQDTAQAALEEYSDIYKNEYTQRMQRKLGLAKWNGAEDAGLVSTLLENMKTDKLDFTRTWRSLARVQGSMSDVEANDEVLKIVDGPIGAVTGERRQTWGDWIRRYAKRTQADGLSDEDRAQAMNSVNPKIILRNYLAQTAIEQAELGEFDEVNRLLQALRSPFDESSPDEYAKEAPAWASRLGVCLNSCSS